MIRFLHGEREVELESMAADTTILAYLRDHAGLTGTKEGCASGDCGACTVVIAHAEDDRLHYQPANACIAPLGSLHGKQLISVENLRDGSTWHPVQRAMVEEHGSQCGFCTPGFVMSLFALSKSGMDREAADSQQAVLEALGGNLCRCTGYRPIVDAAHRALATPDADRFSVRERATVDTLYATDALPADSVALRTTEGAYHRPHNAQDVAALLAKHPDARLLAGGTDLMLTVTQGLEQLPRLIDLCAVAELRSLTAANGHLSIGAAVTHRRAQTLILDEYPELAELIERFGSLQIRSQGTLVGNVANASPIGDWPPVLLALDASLTLQSVDGTRTLPVDQFFLDYRKTALKAGEFIRSVEIPRRPPGLFLRAYKISKRYEDDISSVCGVFALREGAGSARVAFGGMAAIPRRATGCETVLAGRALNDETVAAAAAALEQDFQPITDARASATYRLRVAQNLLRRLQLEVAGTEATRCHPVHYHARPATGAPHD